VCVLVYARTHTQTTWVLDVRPGVGRTPGEPEESRSTKAHYACFDGVNEETNVRANAAVVHGHADVRASAVMTDDNNDNVDDSNFDDTLSEILGTSSRVATSSRIGCT